jgi:hypothetical protein
MKKKQKTKPIARKIAHQYMTHFQPETMLVDSFGSLAWEVTLAIIDETCQNRGKKVTASQHESIQAHVCPSLVGEIDICDRYFDK